ncbi:MAG: hypothetical protein FJX03_02910 [Alphaproteobacteria bacterium]|nr:hypothetical protein [Alphaproteobacteria bacterium]
MDLCPIESCEVEDKESLKQYRACLLRWNRWLFDAPHNALVNQILRMLQYDATFRMINLARELSVNVPNENVGFNWLFLQSYNYGYASSQLSMIRKLACDTRSDVISLRRLIMDITENQHLLTRENYVCYNGLPFESMGLNNNLLSDLRHNQFDHLCKATLTKVKNRKQTVPFKIVEKMLNKLGSCNNLAPVVNKFIAHADDDKGTNKRSYKVTLNRISQCHKEICQLFQFISAHLLGIKHSALMPEFLGSASINMDKAFCLTANLDTLDKFWAEHENTLKSWDREISSGKWFK